MEGHGQVLSDTNVGAKGLSPSAVIPALQPQPDPAPGDCFREFTLTARAVPGPELVTFSFSKHRKESH